MIIIPILSFAFSVSFTATVVLYLKNNKLDKKLANYVNEFNTKIESVNSDINSNNYALLSKHEQSKADVDRRFRSVSQDLDTHKAEFLDHQNSVIAKETAAKSALDSQLSTINNNIKECVDKIDSNHATVLKNYNDLNIKTENSFAEISKIIDFQHNSFTSYQNSLEARETSIEGRQSAIESRFSMIENRQSELEQSHNEFEDNLGQLHENHAILSDDFDTISKSITEKSNPVYVQDKGSAVCSKCNHNVVRYFYDGPSIVCANCDPKSYAELIRG